MYTEIDGRITVAIEAITRMVNTFSTDRVRDQFTKEMSMQHRTLQQSFTRLALQWIEHVASDEYRTDGRNETGHKICKQLLEVFRAEMQMQGWSNLTLDIMSKPSGYCSMV